MIGSDILLFPDTGDDFLRSLRTAVLYSRKVHVLTLIDPLFIEVAEKFMEGADPDDDGRPMKFRRVFDYLRFITESHRELRQLEDAGVLIPLQHTSWEKLRTTARSKAYQSVSERLKTSIAKHGEKARFKPEIRECLERGLSACLPSYFDVDLMGAIRRAAEGDQEMIKHLEDADAVTQFSFMPYLLIVATVAEERGIGLMSWSPEVRDAVWMMRERFTKPASASQSKLAVRQNAEAVLGQMLLQKYLPRVADDAPFEEILRMRESCADELEAFRVGVAEVATQVDPTQWREDYELHARDLIATRVDPAVQDLKESLKAPRRGALSNVWLAATPVAVGLSFMAGASLDLVAAIGLLGTGIQMLEGSGDRKKLPHASQWSILLGK